MSDDEKPGERPVCPHICSALLSPRFFPFELNVLSAGIIITRADELQDLFIELGKLTAAGMSTTHMSKLFPTFCYGRIA
jgi:Restriction endonuclease BglII